MCLEAGGGVLEIAPPGGRRLTWGKGLPRGVGVWEETMRLAHGSFQIKVMIIKKRSLQKNKINAELMLNYSSS